MSHVLMDWLRRRLGASIECNVENLGQEFFDGKLYFKILQSYKVVNEGYSKTLVTANNAESAMKNLNQLCFWLKLLGVNHSEHTMNDIAEGKNSACLKLLFEMYVCLENREAWFFVQKKKAEQVVRDPDTDKFKVIKAPDTLNKVGLKVHQNDESPFAMPLYNKWQMINDHREKLNKIFRRCRQDTEKRRHALQKLEEGDEIKGMRRNVCGPLPGRNDMDALKTREEIRDFSINLSQRKQEEIIKCNPEDFVSLLKVMRRKAEANKVLTGKMHNMLMNEVWSTILETQEKKFHEELGSTLSKQSQFEKEMCLRLSQIHHQHKIFVENRRLLHRLAEKHQESAGYFEETYVVLRREENEDAKMERLRVQLLHRKMFAEKLRQKYERHYKLCYELIEDITDMAIKVAETEAEQGFPVSRKMMNEWKALFYKSLPLFLFEDEETILARSLRRPEVNIIGEQEEMEEESLAESNSCAIENRELSDYEYLIRLDLEAVDEVNEQNLQDYLCLLGPWLYEYWPETGEIDSDEVQNVLGFIVHRLLEFKYPLPSPPQPADIPNYPIKVVLNNLNDQSLIEKLKVLLAKPAIALIDMPTATNYCIEEYVKYEDPEEIKTFLEKKAAKDGLSAKTESKGKSEKKSEWNKGTANQKKEKRAFKDMEVQVPSVVDVTAPRVRSAAEILGQEAVKALTFGQPVSDILLVKCLVEYIKSLRGINGWVLLNYPKVCTQIELLEFIMTANLPPVVCSSASSDIKLFIAKETNLHLSEELLKLRSSKLVPKMTTTPPTPVFYPYFNMYINLQTKSEANKSAKQKIPAKAMGETPGEKDGELEGDAHFEQPILMEDSKPDSFYKGYDIFRNYVYESLDLPTLKDLARTIIGQADVAENLRVPSVELFGQEILQSLTPKKGKSAGDKKSASSKITNDSKERSSKKVRTEEKTLWTVKHVSIVENKDIGMEEQIPQTPPVPQLSTLSYPGDAHWVYSVMPIQDELQVLLASIWENIETVYLDCLKQIFFMYRVQNSIVIPYRNYIRTIMEEIVERPDNRQKYVTEFQEILNNIPDELRYKQRVKAELHCKVFDLQETLSEMSDYKKNRSETKRRELISQNWLAIQLTMMANNFLLMIQVETNRFVDTLQLLHDYFFGSLGLQLDPNRLSKIEVPRLSQISDFSKPSAESFGVDQSNTKKSSLQKQTMTGVNARADFVETKKPSTGGFPQYPHSSVMELLLNVDVDVNLKSAIHSSFTEVVNTLLEEIVDIAKKIKGNVGPILKPIHTKGKKDKSKSDVPRSKKKGSPAEQNSLTEPQDPCERMFLEWETAVDNEMRRVLFRIRLIKERALNDMSEIQYIIQTNFHGFYNDIVNVYRRDMSNIAALCTLLRTAIEEETAIQPKLLLGQEKFRVDGKSLMFADPPVPPPTALRELEDDYLFTVRQLNNLFAKLKTVAPIGIVKEAFLDILEDMKYLGHENGYSYIPKSWSQLERKDLRFVLDSAFGESLLIDWRDFIVFALNVPYPTVEQIVEARQTFLAYDPERAEVVNREDYGRVTLWFEKELGKTLQDDLRCASIKWFLFDLYRINEDQSNYTALLLAFCKEEDPVEGFGKALALATGTGFVIRPELLYLAEEDETEEERKRNESLIVAEQIELQLLTDVMQYALGDVIEEMEAESAKEEEVGAEEEEMSRWEFQYPMEGEVMEEEEEISSKMTSRIKWVALVSYETALSVLVAALHFYALPAEHADKHVDLERNLLTVFREKGEPAGRGSPLIMAHTLAASPFLRDLFARVYIFKTCDLTRLVHHILMDRYTPDKDYGSL